MTKNQSNIRIFGEDNDAVWVAAKGSTLPTTLAAPASPFAEIGWLGEDGINLDQSLTVNKFNAHQGGAQVRQKTSAVERSFTFQAIEETALVLGLYYPGITGSTSGVAPSQVTTFQVPAGARSNEKAWVVDSFDGTIQKRHVIPVGEVGETGTISHTNSGLAIYEFTVNIMGGFSIISNAAGLVVVP